MDQLHHRRSTVHIAFQIALVARRMYHIATPVTRDIFCMPTKHVDLVLSTVKRTSV